MIRIELMIKPNYCNECGKRLKDKWVNVRDNYVVCLKCYPKLPKAYKRKK